MDVLESKNKNRRLSRVEIEDLMKSVSYLYEGMKVIKLPFLVAIYVRTKTKIGFLTFKSKEVTYDRIENVLLEVTDSLSNKPKDNPKNKYEVIHLAKYIINRCVKADEPINNIQLQKILYLIYIEYFNNGHEIFDNEFEAWQFGPVIPNVYYQYCGFGSLTILMEYPKMEGLLFEEDKPIINNIIEKNRKKMPWELMTETQFEGSPWEITYDDGNGDHSRIKM